VQTIHLLAKRFDLLIRVINLRYVIWFNVSRSPRDIESHLCFFETGCDLSGLRKGIAFSSLKQSIHRKRVANTWVGVRLPPILMGIQCK
jgi:hypothetical protein